MLVVLREQTVGRLKGVVSIGSEEQPGRGVVIEVYRYDGEAAGVDTTEFLQSAKRSAACLTDENGVFEFPSLKPGRYLLVAGTVESAGINEARMIARITRWRRSHKIKIRLPLGT